MDIRFHWLISRVLSGHLGGQIGILEGSALFLRVPLRLFCKVLSGISRGLTASIYGEEFPWIQSLLHPTLFLCAELHTIGF